MCVLMAARMASKKQKNTAVLIPFEMARGQIPLKNGLTPLPSLTTLMAAV